MKWRDWVFANRHRGEVVARINGRRRRMQLSLSALAQLESCYGNKDILAVLDGFSQSGLGVKDAENIIRAGLAATDNVLAETGAPLDVDGGDAGALRLAETLIERAFNGSIFPTPANTSPHKEGRL